jgi:hypothetical protein
MAKKQLQPVDLDTFRTLMNRDDEAFLRDKLSRAMFFRLKRQRIRVAWSYVRRMAQNAAAGVQLASSLRRNPDERVAKAAKTMTDHALRVRRYCRIAFVKMALEYIFPAVNLRIHTR